MRQFSEHYCVKCGALETEPARESCGNPQWHDGYAQSDHFKRACESGDHCQCYEDGLRCCTCRDRKL